ncbi:hypothetical protein DsansV1_C04g0047801 [Dioscorea sansibarensis]
MSRQDTHWCHACSRAIQPYPSDMICPQCYGGFIQELNEVDGGRNAVVNVARMGMDVHRNHAMHDVGGEHNMFHDHHHGRGGMDMDFHRNHAMDDVGGTHNTFHNHGHGMGGMGMDLHGTMQCIINHGMGGMAWIFTGTMQCIIIITGMGGTGG